MNWFTQCLRCKDLFARPDRDHIQFKSGLCEGCFADTNLILKAELFAKRAHGSQVRKYNKEPYWLHLREVAMLVEAAGGNEAQIASAWLHDTVEDTAITLKEIVDEFGCEVGIYVDDLTDISKHEEVLADGSVRKIPREERRRIDREHTASIHPNAMTVKLADLISNSSSINRFDPHFAKLYMAEKKLLLEHLQGGDIYLYKMAQGIVRRYYEGQTASAV